MQLCEIWVEAFFIQVLHPGQGVIMDHASFPKSQKMKEWIESVGCSVFYLHYYYPDLNPKNNFELN